MKICRLCHASKHLDEFGTSQRSPDGKHWACRRCWNAYVNRKRHAQGAKPIPPFLHRLWDNIAQCGHEEACPFCCWPWRKGCDKDGYGRISLAYNGKRHSYHVTRIVFEVWNGVQLPDDLCACHYCDNPICSNPMHIWAGTRIDNRMDCVKKKRHATPYGERHPQAKLTHEDVVTIRAYHKQGFAASYLAMLYDVNETTIRCLLTHKTWKSL